MNYAIEVNHLSKSFGATHAVNDVSIAVKPGEAFGLLGANGAGKTTLTECILAVKKPDAGAVRVLELDPARNRKNLFEQIGVQFQEARYQDKIRVNELCHITASLYKNSADYHGLLEQFGLSGKEDSFVSALSGGLRQRLFIVLALIPQPRVVFLDELTTGLDVKSRREVWCRLKTLKDEGITMLMTTHFMDEVEALCDRIAIMRKGSVVFSGTPRGAIASAGCKTLEDAYLYYAEGETDESI